MTPAKVDVARSGEAVKEAVGQAEIEPVVITRKGKDVAVLLPLDDDDYESIASSLSPGFMALIERGNQSITENGGISFEEMKHRLGISDE